LERRVATIFAAMMQIKEAKKLLAEAATAHSKEEADACAHYILENYLGITKTDWAMNREGELDAIQQTKCADVALRLANNEPVQYICGFAWFMDHQFLVNRSVLIPRQETEELVRHIIEDQKKTHHKKYIDLGTGSGCIAVSLAKYISDAEIVAVDISKEALEVAKNNAQQIVGNNHQIKFMQGDLLDESFQMTLPQVDVIVSNPPYVTPIEQLMMHKQVLDYEPHLALFTPLNDSLIFYRVICQLSKNILSTNGTIYFEINEQYGEEVKQLMAENKFTNIQLLTDMQGKVRMVKGEKGAI
jgi:release factor glutamine methyltransferase